MPLANNRFLTVFLPDVLALVEKRGGVTDPNVPNRSQRSAVMAMIIKRYDYLMRSELPTLRQIFNSDEIGLMCDAANGLLHTEPETLRFFVGEVASGIRYKSLAEKWQVDGITLIEKLENLTELQTFALVDAIDAYWAGSLAGDVSVSDFSKILE